MADIRNKNELYPDYTAEIEAIDEGGITIDLLKRIIRKHRANARYNKSLYERYEAVDGAVPITLRTPRFEEEVNAINNKLNNDFFGEIVDFKTGYFAGRPISYSYSDTQEAQEDTGGEGARDAASDALMSFVTRNNMFKLDMEITKLASICGYAGRLLYHDVDGNERVMPVKPFECIILSDTDITEPRYAVRYYSTTDINDQEIWYVEFYDSTTIKYYKGDLENLTSYKQDDKNLYGYCPLQGIPNNGEMLGDAEKVMALIDGYDRALSDASNDIESFASAYMVFENINMTQEEMEKGQKTGAFQFWGGGQAPGKIYFLTKNVNDGFIEHHLDRLEENIYRFSKTPNLSDDSFGNATGVALKFKLTGLETKCGMFQAQMLAAGTYMFKLLSEAWGKKKIAVDPLQCVMEFKRNFPLDTLNEAQTVQSLINAGLPKRVAFQELSIVDDVEYVMQLIEEEKGDIPSLTDPDEDDEGGSGGNPLFKAEGDGDEENGVEDWVK